MKHRLSREFKLLSFARMRFASKHFQPIQCIILVKNPYGFQPAMLAACAILEYVFTELPSSCGVALCILLSADGAEAAESGCLRGLSQSEHAPSVCEPHLWQTHVRPEHLQTGFTFNISELRWPNFLH